MQTGSPANIKWQHEPISPPSAAWTSPQDITLPTLSVPSPSTPASCKRWGMFMLKYKIQHSQILFLMTFTFRKPSYALKSRGEKIESTADTGCERSLKFLKKSATTKSAPDLKALGKATGAKRLAPPVRPVPPLPQSATVPPSTKFPVADEEQEGELTNDFNDKGIYFGCDPRWDPSQGDATLFLISPVDDVPAAADCEELIVKRQRSFTRSTHSLPLDSPNSQIHYHRSPQTQRMHPIDELHSYLEL
ncbi:hypothetical protein SERLA73DRAFT_181481 [Serpula lacrymans var. lacrymans S7.3]|uniref:Uncharacterized protein n=2 Tax=Serpula lacrymans var. lacrymans TaxID=341189 RepID=F8PY58_SERL3|nr:uncharacterized protein SERLADRAFT_467650 [Serpula lacrymans var. lacrymans S7.9]EGN98821.1 hypothetical protein SERLA73DRAFT_181481 [Serpula lacrymans var. lacrymans S7.3]EGO24412.1 hypothetical protein SERLADRAFT_467650 [Serpula lacrymans var. lacrymans S7.9]